MISFGPSRAASLSQSRSKQPRLAPFLQSSQAASPLTLDDGSKSLRDFHSHLLPGVDDGVQTYEDSLEILARLSELGFSEVYLTPHFIHGTSQVSPVFENRKRFDLLRAKAIRAKIPITLHLGNEIYLDPDIEKLLRFGQVKPLGRTELLLVELPMSGEYPGYQDIFYQLLSNGHQVVLAHPKRYLTFQKDYNLALELHALGVLFQVNYGSFAGQYGRHAQKTALKLLKDDLIFAYGTDLHRASSLDYLKPALAKIEKHL